MKHIHAVFKEGTMRRWELWVMMSGVSFPEWILLYATGVQDELEKDWLWILEVKHISNDI